jgi:hypothetical protein
LQVIGDRRRGLFPSPNGRTTIPINLTSDAVNEVSIDAIDLAGNRAGPVVFLIIVDTTAPSLRILEPEQGTTFRSDTALLRIQTEPGALLWVHGREIGLGPGGECSTEVPLWEGENRVDVEVIDEVGNVANVTLVLYYEPVEDKPSNDLPNIRVAFLGATLTLVLASTAVILWRWRTR